MKSVAMLRTRAMTARFDLHGKTVAEKLWLQSITITEFIILFFVLLTVDIRLILSADMLMVWQWEFPRSTMIIWNSCMKEIPSLQCCRHMQLSLPWRRSSSIWCLVTYRDLSSVQLWYFWVVTNFSFSFTWRAKINHTFCLAPSYTFCIFFVNIFWLCFHQSRTAFIMSAEVLIVELCNVLLNWSSLFIEVHS